MKKLRCIGYKQTFDVNEFGIFGRLIKQDEGWVIRGLHYFYIEENADIEQVYLLKYRVRNNGVVSGWGDWYTASNNVNLCMSDRCFKNIKTKIVEIYNDITPTMKSLWKDMDAEQFKEWFHDKETERVK